MNWSLSVADLVVVVDDVVADIVDSADCDEEKLFISNKVLFETLE